ncbi:tyrosine-type recombinase/integrase [Escherichia coli]|uniref:tyrosine-type recombinase/integrase n=2 Tax=Enterobacteriaceae TaxID=543 RepID=UPI0030C7C454
MSTPKRFRFTNQLIKSLPPNTSDARSTDAEYSDTEISGLKCLVSKGEGRKKFLLRYLYHGRKRAIAIGRWPEVDVTLARKIAMEHKRSLATGTDPKQERENKRQEMTFDELFNQHYLPWAKSAKRSWGKDVQRYRDHIRPAIGQRLLSDITPASILRLQQTLSTSLSAATCNRVIVLIKAVFTWAGRQSMTSVHPARVVQLLRENNARQRYFTEDEIRRIFLSADNDTSPVAARYVKLLLLTGLRRDELRLAKWEHVDPVKRTLWLPETKNGYGRIVHLNSLAMDVIRTLPTQRGKHCDDCMTLVGTKLGVDELLATFKNGVPKFPHPLHYEDEVRWCPAPFLSPESPLKDDDDPEFHAFLVDLFDGPEKHKDKSN